MGKECLLEAKCQLESWPTSYCTKQFGQVTLNSANLSLATSKMEIKLSKNLCLKFGITDYSGNQIKCVRNLQRL